MPKDNTASQITPTEYELFVKEFLIDQGQGLQNFTIKHNIISNQKDGDYQIDVYAEFKSLDVSFKVLIECKKHKDPIKREVVQLLFDKIRATGSHKGIIFSTSVFQSGAVTFAQEHGIALVTMVDGRNTYHTRSRDKTKWSVIPIDSTRPKFVGLFRNGNTISFLKIGHFSALKDFLVQNLIM